MGALIRALTNNAVENIEEALGMTDATSSAMKHAIAEWYAAWYGRVPTKTEDPCQRLPYAIVNKLCKATFGEYDSGLQHTDSAKGKYLDCVRSAFDACKTSFMTQAMIGGEAWAKPVPMPDGRLTWQIVGRDSVGCGAVREIRICRPSFLHAGRAAHILCRAAHDPVPPVLLRQQKHTGAARAAGKPATI